MAFDWTIKSHLPTPTKILLLQLKCYYNCKLYQPLCFSVKFGDPIKLQNIRVICDFFNAGRMPALPEGGVICVISVVSLFGSNGKQPE